MRRGEKLRAAKQASESDLVFLAEGYIDQRPDEALRILEGLPVEASETTAWGYRWYYHALALSMLNRLEECEQLLATKLNRSVWEAHEHRAASQLLAYALLERAKTSGDGDEPDWLFVASRVDVLRAQGVDNDWLRHLKGAAHSELGSWEKALEELESIEGHLDDAAESRRWLRHAKALWLTGRPTRAWDVLNRRMTPDWPREVRSVAEELLDNIDSDAPMGASRSAGDWIPEQRAESVKMSSRFSGLRRKLKSAHPDDVKWLILYSAAVAGLTPWLIMEAMPLLGMSGSSFDPIWFGIALGCSAISWYYWIALFSAVLVRR